MKRAFSRKVAIVTGAASGIGRELSALLAGVGAQVVLADIDLGGAERAAAHLSLDGGRCEAARLDVSDPEAVSALVESTCERHGRLDLMFNNAGIAIVGDTAQLSLSQWNRLIDTNFKGVLHGTMAAYRTMIEQGDGHIVNTASIAGLMPVPHFTAYSATKHAIVGLSTSLRFEAERHGVRVSVACPGVIDTPMAHTTEQVGLDRKATQGDMLVKPYGARACARDILAGVKRNDGVIVITAAAKALHRLHRASPWLTTQLTRLMLRRMG